MIILIKLVTDDRKGVIETIEEYAIVDEVNRIGNKLEITIYYYGSHGHLKSILKKEFGKEIKIYDWLEFNYKLPKMVRKIMEEMKDDLFSNRKEK